MDNMYLENIEEFIHDENKIVTYRWLSLTLKVSSNVAKQMIYHYYEKHKDSKSEDIKLSASYLVSGVKYDENLKRDCKEVCIVNEDELEKVKERLKKVDSVHLYSLQKSKLKDLNILYATDYDKIKENALTTVEYSAITCPSAKSRTLDSIKYEEQSTEVTNIKESEIGKNVKDEEDGENKENKNKENIKAPPSKKGPKGALLKMFANQNKTGDENRKQQKMFEEGKTSKPPNKCKKGSLDLFLTKNAPTGTKDKQVSRGPVKIKEEPNTEIKVEEETVINSERLSDKEEECEEEEPKGSKRTQSPKSKSFHNKKKSRASKGKRNSSETASSVSKRRRIVKMDSSSDSSEDEEEEEASMQECPIPSPHLQTKAIESDDEDEIIPPTPEVNMNDKGTKRKKRKMVSKTFVDDDGYIVTKKEFEWVSESDDEESPVPPSKSSSPPSETPVNSKTQHTREAKSTKSPVKTKQSSIMNFFKKKT